MSEPPLSLDRYAEAAVYCREYTGAELAAVLDKLGTNRSDVEAAASYWGRAIADDLLEGDPTHVLQFAHVYGKVAYRVRLYRPTPDEVRPEPIASPEERNPRVKLRAMKPLTRPTDASEADAATPAAPEEQIPTYLHKLREEPGPKFGVVPLHELDLDTTAPINSRQVARGAGAASVPFNSEAPARTPDAHPIAEDQSGETVMGTVRALVDEPSHARSHAPTVALPSLPLPIERFVQIQAALSGAEDSGDVLRHFGIAAQQWSQTIDQVNAVMRGDPALRARYEQLWRVARQRR